MKDTFYFPHDYNAISDPKLMLVLSNCWLSGIGMYRIIIEILHQQENNTITYEAYKKYVKFYSTFENDSEQMFNKIEQVLITCWLLINNNNLITSNRVAKNKDKRMEISEKRSLAWKLSAKRRASQKETSTSVQQNWTSVQQNWTSVQQGKEKKGKEKKEKEKENKEQKEEISDEIVSYGNPSINLILDLIKENNNWIVDWKKDEQRKYWKLLLDKLEEIKSVKEWKFTPFDILELILKVISENNYHSQKIAWPKKIYYELAWLMQICKQELIKKNKTIKEF